MARTTREFIPTAQHMLALVPMSEVLLRQDIEKAIGESGFRPPENQAQNWVQLARALSVYFGKRKPRADWEVELVRVFEGGK